MSIFTRIFHFIRKKEEELLAVNNAKRIYNAWKRWWGHSEPSDDRPLKVACALNDSSHGLDPNRVAQTPVTPLSEMKIACAPRSVEILPPAPPVQVVPPQSPVPGQTIDVQPSQEVITRDKNFF
jgi:hypothetical protein